MILFDDRPTEIWINGHWKAPAEATVSVMDRGFLYGDGLFETVRVHDGRLFRWEEHLRRFNAGARHLKILSPFPPSELTAAACALVRKGGVPEAMVRLTMSRGVGHRGYSPRGADHPTVVLSHHPAPLLDPESPVRWRLVTSPLLIPAGSELSSFKTSNKLLQVLARAGADELGADEALLLNTRGEVVEAASANVFWVEDGRIHTPPPHSGALPGITRDVVLELAGELGIRALEDVGNPARLGRSEGVFLTLSSLGVVEVSHLDRCALPIAPCVDLLRRAYITRLSQALDPAC